MWAAVSFELLGLDALAAACFEGFSLAWAVDEFSENVRGFVQHEFPLSPAVSSVATLGILATLATLATLRTSMVTLMVTVEVTPGYLKSCRIMAIEASPAITLEHNLAALQSRSAVSSVRCFVFPRVVMSATPLKQSLQGASCRHFK
jgi:hypothetical protein